MKRLALLLILLLAVAGFLGWAISQSAGYVLITYDQFRYESSFWVFLALIASLWLVAVVVHWLLGLLQISGALVNPWSRRHRERRVEKASRSGLRELAEGQWAPALNHLQLAAEKDRQPLVHYLGAARAANELGEYAQSDELLQKAREREPEAALAIGLTQAQLQIARGQYVEARASLSELQNDHPRHPYVLTLLQQLYVQLEDWAALCRLLPELRKHRVLPAAKLSELEVLAWTAAVEQAGQPSELATEASIEALNQRWQTVPSALRGEPLVVRAYVDGLARLGAQGKPRRFSTRRSNGSTTIDWWNATAAYSGVIRRASWRMPKAGSRTTRKTPCCCLRWDGSVCATSYGARRATISRRAYASTTARKPVPSWRVSWRNWAIPKAAIACSSRESVCSTAICPRLCDRLVRSAMCRA